MTRRPTAATVATALLALSSSGLSSPAAAQAADDDARAAVSAVLDDFHDAAATADFERYFGHFAEGAVFLGTDASEHWTLEEFRAYARPRFQAGGGWTYAATSRHVYLSPDGSTAWFDELLHSESYGETRGTGVLVRENGLWKVAQYHLTIPVPNELAGRVVEMIRREGG